MIGLWLTDWFVLRFEGSWFSGLANSEGLVNLPGRDEELPWRTLGVVWYGSRLVDGSAGVEQCLLRLKKGKAIVPSYAMVVVQR